MKTNLLTLITTSCLPALFALGNAAAQTPTFAGSERIKVYTYHEYGSPDVLRLEEIEKPVPTDDQVLVKIRAASVNPLDWHYMEGTPYIVRPLEFGLFSPKVPRLGVDMAGQVEAVGKNVTAFKPGDEVFGQRFGAFGEYVTVRADRALVIKPSGVTFEQAAALPVAAITALQGLRDKGKIQAGQKVLINGASGGVGTFAVQLAKMMGAEVTGVCSGRNVELVKSLGADHVIDYTKEDYTKNGQRYDVMIDNVANHSFLENTGVLNPQGKYVMIGGGGPGDQGFIGPMILPIKIALIKRFVSQEAGFMVAEVTKNDLSYLADLVQSGKLKVVIDKTYPLSQLPEAMRYLETGRARGKVIITVGDNAETVAPPSSKITTNSATSPLLVVLGIIGVPLAALILPVIAAFVLNRRFRKRNPEKRSYRWGYYFSIMAFIGGLLLGRFLSGSVITIILCGVFYALLAWFFAQRQRWAWIALTILSFNPIAWIINAIYLWKRWRENPEPGGALAEA
jgi:NADPH:quinone reductase-like Zn-dependent oxidoreductase